MYISTNGLYTCMYGMNFNNPTETKMFRAVFVLYLSFAIKCISVYAFKPLSIFLQRLLSAYIYFYLIFGLLSLSVSVYLECDPFVIESSYANLSLDFAACKMSPVDSAFPIVTMPMSCG